MFEFIKNKVISARKAAVKAKLVNLESHYQHFKEVYYKQLGDTFEIYVGQLYENEYFLVIYNGLIKGLKDQGVDLIAIPLPSDARKEIHLIQCKNWLSSTMGTDVASDALRKLERYNVSDIEKISPHMVYKNMRLDALDYYNKPNKQFNNTDFANEKKGDGTIDSFDRESITNNIIINTTRNLNEYDIVKILYVSSFDVLTDNLKNNLIFINEFEYRYGDMKVKINGLSNNSKESNQTLSMMESLRDEITQLKIDLDNIK